MMLGINDVIKNWESENLLERQDEYLKTLIKASMRLHS
jgi:hypothetical protein